MVTAVFRNRFSTAELLQILAYCAFPIHFWAIMYMLRSIPSWVLYMTPSELIGIMAYTFCFALVETIVIFVLAILPGLILPRRWLKNKYPSVSSLLILEFAVLGFILIGIFANSSPPAALFISFILVLILSVFLVYRAPAIKVGLEAVALRLVPLVGFYLILDLIGTSIVLLRNI
jgi:hypothetical protein